MPAAAVAGVCPASGCAPWRGEAQHRAASGATGVSHCASTASGGCARLRPVGGGHRSDGGKTIKTIAGGACQTSARALFCSKNHLHHGVAGEGAVEVVELLAAGGGDGEGDAQVFAAAAFAQLDAGG